MTTDESGPGLDRHQAADNAGYPSIHRMDVDRQLERAELSSRQIWRCSTGMVSPCRSPEVTTQLACSSARSERLPHHHHLGLAPPARPRFLPPCFHSRFPIRSRPATSHQSPGAPSAELPAASGVRAGLRPPSLVAATKILLRASIGLIELMEPGAAAAAAAATAIYPLHRCKTIHLVRHAQGVHNVEGDTDHSAYMKPEFFDARVTPLGWNQIDRLGDHVKKCGLAEKIELVICSPLLRTMQTAVGVFGGESYSNGVSVPPLMVENAADSGRPAVSSVNCPPFLAVEACRERLGVHPCDKRRSVTEYRALFPAIDFSLIESDEDVLWVPDVRETFESLAQRGMKFFDWLWTREEREIAIVTHSGLLCHTLRMYSKECHPTVRQEVSKYFANCELRSLVLVDRSMLGSDGPSYNYPGKIPAGLDLPSDDVAADKKQPCIEEAQDRT